MPRDNLMHQASSTSTLTTLASQDLLTSANRTRPGTASYGRYPDGPEDPRRNCSSQLNKHYTWEVPTPADSRLPTASTHPDDVSILSAVTSKQGTISMGKRKKEDCLKGTGAEILVGFDTVARAGLRVVVSERSSFVKPPGKPCCGTIIKTVNNGAESVVMWDNEQGPFRYASCQNLGFHLSLASAVQEQEFAFHKDQGVGVHLLYSREHATSRETAGCLAAALQSQGCVVRNVEGSGVSERLKPPDMQELHQARFCVLLLDEAMHAELRNRGSVAHKELEYVLQTMQDPAASLAILRVPPAPPPHAGLGLLTLPLGRATAIALPSPSPRDMQAAAAQLAGAAAAAAASPARASTRASR